MPPCATASPDVLLLVTVLAGASNFTVVHFGRHLQKIPANRKFFKALTTRPRIAVFRGGCGWEDVAEVVDAVAVQVRAARDHHAHLELTRSVEQFERLLRWLGEHSQPLKLG